MWPKRGMFEHAEYALLFQSFPHVYWMTGADLGSFRSVTPRSLP